MAKPIIPQLKEKGKVTRGWLGVQTQSLTPDLAKSFALEGDKGALVADIIKDTPAEKAGIKVGDIIIEFDAKPVREANELSRLVAATPPGRKVGIKLFRDGKEKLLDVVLEPRKDDGETAAPELAAPDKLGLTVSELTRDLAATLRIKEMKGVVVVEVKPGGPAEDAGIMRGDIVLEVNGKKVSTVEDYEQGLKAPTRGGFVRMLLRRGEIALIVAVKVE
jgi:serine protease Do